MYSWYMPKDSPSAGLGHRHDWENVVVWLSAQSTSATITGVAISAHGDYQKNSSPPLQGTSPKIGYISYYPVNHQLIATNDLGGQQPLIAWDSMTAAARTALETTVSGPHLTCCRLVLLICAKSFGSATPSFRDNNFQSYLAKAFF